MTCLRTAVCALLLCVISATTMSAQPRDDHLNLSARVLDRVFPLNFGPDPYNWRLILRYGDSNTQLALVIYPGGRCEILRYSLAGTGDSDLSRLVSKVNDENRDVNDQEIAEIAAKLKVNVERSSVDLGTLNHILNDLRALQISPILANRVAMDNASEYEYWYDTSQESVHYTISGPFEGDPQDKLVQWMLRFRASLPDLLKASSAPKP